jgi:cysteine desulfuration protein SufE
MRRKAHLPIMAGIDQTIEDIADEYVLLAEWDEGYSHTIAQGRALQPLRPDERTEMNRVRGCASATWLVSEKHAEEPEKLFFRAQSESFIVSGLIAVLLRVFSGRTPEEILSVDPKAIVKRIGFEGTLTEGRSNGLSSMIKRIQDEARAAL